MPEPVLWYLVRGRTVLGQVRAPDIATARALLKPDGRTMVLSAVSYGLGWHPRVILDEQKDCARCYQPLTPAEAARDTMHPPCRKLYREAYARRLAKMPRDPEKKVATAS